MRRVYVIQEVAQFILFLNQNKKNHVVNQPQETREMMFVLVKKIGHKSQQTNQFQCK